MPVYSIDTTRAALPTFPAVVAPGSPVWVEVRPGIRRGATIAGDILTALGKRPDVAGKGRNEHLDIELAVAWLRAYNTPHVVLTEAQRIPTRALPKIAQWAVAADVALWLAHRPSRDDDWLAALARRRPHERPAAELPTPVARDDQLPDRPSELNACVPRAPFHRWLQAVSVLPAPERQIVLDRHARRTHAYLETFKRHGATLEAVVRLLEQILAPAPDDELLVTDIRALQLAAWHHEQYLRCDLPTLLASEHRPRVDPAQTDRLMTAYRAPHRAVVVALTAAQVSLTVQRTLTRSNITREHQIRLPDGTPVDLGQHAQRALRALLNTLPDEPDRPLLPNAPRQLSQALLDARADLGVSVHSRRAQEQRRPHTWLRSLGLTLSSLTTGAGT